MFAAVQFRISPTNFIVAPALNHITSVAGEVAQDLAETPADREPNCFRVCRRTVVFEGGDANHEDRNNARRCGRHRPAGRGTGKNAGRRHRHIGAEDLEALANPDYLFRALSNLVRNAIRYAGQAGPISVSARCEDGEAVIIVADRGPGVPENALEDVFTPFFRLDASRNRSGGTGWALRS